MGKIEQGDQVKHKNHFINGGLMMSVSDVEEGKVLCTHITKDEVWKEEWFDMGDLELVSKADGGFI